MHAKYPLFLPLLCGFLLSSIPCMGETVKDLEGALRSDKAKMEKGDRWVYNDVPQGFLEAKKRGKPLMAVLRCVPCLACMGMDARQLGYVEGGDYSSYAQFAFSQVGPMLCEVRLCCRLRTLVLHVTPVDPEGRREPPHYRRHIRDLPSD